MLHQVSPETYAFPHRTFQEYFAAMRLIDQAYWPDQNLYQRILAVIDDSQLQQVLKLAMSALNLTGRISDAADVLANLLETCQPFTTHGTQRATIIGELVQELDSEKLHGTFAGRKLKPALINDHLLPLFSEQAADIPIELRLEGTIVLGHLGDPRLGVATLEPDWVEVPAGPFLFGSTNDDKDALANEKPQRTLDLPAYRIARYPVTNAQFRMFVEDGGYTTDRWWTPVGLQERNENQWGESRWFEEPTFNALNKPVVGVSWYEAIAYCAWLSAQLGYEVRLPTEAEWEKAARCVDGRIYPWGNGWDAARVNAEWRLGKTSPVGLSSHFQGVSLGNLQKIIDKTSPVGLFPHGASPYGALDMSSNVFDWVLSRWDSADPMLHADVLDINNRTRVLFRGGAWFNGPRFARSACRLNGNPGNRLNNRGFRLLTSIMST